MRRSQPDDREDPAEVAANSQLRDLMRLALDENATRAPDVLQGVQRKLRERSGGKFYDDRWSTARHPPISTYLITSLIMLAILLLSLVVLYPFEGRPEPVRSTPAPINVLPPP